MYIDIYIYIYTLAISYWIAFGVMDYIVCFAKDDRGLAASSKGKPEVPSKASKGRGPKKGSIAGPKKGSIARAI